MIQFHVFPEGKKRVVTFSYDDGHKNDGRLVDLFNKYGVKATFHLNGGNYSGASEQEKEELRKLYEGHEVSCHTLQHGWITRMPLQSVVLETLEDRKTLENIFGYPVIGMSYPCGAFDDSSISAMRACGIVYSRTVRSTRGFELPTDFMHWDPTCHHNGALELCDRFIGGLDSVWGGRLFYIWGHSHEFVTEEDWDKMETVLQKISGNGKIWYATNIDIYNYMMAQRMLQISADETMFYNPTSIDVWVEKDKKDIIKIPAGQRIEYK